MDPRQRKSAGAAALPGLDEVRPCRAGGRPTVETQHDGVTASGCSGEGTGQLRIEELVLGAAEEGDVEAVGTHPSQGLADEGEFPSGG